MKNSPKLRFPEFKDNGEWEEKRLDSIADVVPSGDLDSEYFSLISTDKHIYPVYSNSVTEEGLYGYYTYPKYEKNSVTITARGTLGVAFTRHQDFMGIGRLLVVSNLQNTLPYFLKESWNYLAKIPLENGGIPQLTAVKAKAVLLAIPKPNEQQKIADCLSSVDSLISVQSQKVELLKEHKKALMQQLFPQDGEEAPKLRFPEFKNAPKWEENPLGSFCSTTTGKLDANAMIENGQYRFYTCAKNYYFIDNYAFDTEALLVSGNGANVGYIHYFKGKFNAYQRTYVLDGFSENIIFIKYYLEHSLHKRIATEKKEGNTPYIVMSTLTDMAITLPKPEEQQKIANCLSFIDELITAQTAKAEALKEHKKGLMQQLFPKSK